MQSYDAQRFRRQVSSALDTVHKVLVTSRNPQIPDNVNHEYLDKYTLADAVTNMAIASQINCLDSLGLSSKNLQILKEWSSTRSVTLRLKSAETCIFDREVKRDVENVSSQSTYGWSGSSVTHKVVTTITEYFWDWKVDYELFAFKGSESDEKIVLQKRTGTTQLMTSTNTTPRPKSTVCPSLDINITWLLNMLGSNMNLNFSIKRDVPSCHTPRRNNDINIAFTYFTDFYTWANKVHSYFNALIPVQQGHNLDFSKINTSGIFVPVLPLFEDGPKKLAIEDKKSEGHVPTKVVTSSDMGGFLQEQARSLQEKQSLLAKDFPDNKKIATVAEAKLMVTCLHAKQISEYFADGIDHIEAMLVSQLIASIGKVVTPVDFQNFMIYHNRTIFKKEFAPKPFSYAIRLPDHYPEGLIGIEKKLNDGSIAEPIYTITKSGPTTKPMRFPINAATNVLFSGDRYLHSFVNYEFSDSTGCQLKLVARARQFSCFMLLAGTVANEDLFLPKCSILLQNKDDLKIPLILETIPTPKAFKDAIESLSGEQQRFAKSYRGMQLAGTLFGVVVIQIKPQLERLLNLPYDSLTKEIRLTQDLLEMFIKYQIPSDLLSYDGSVFDELPVKINRVKQNVANIQQMIQDAKNQEIEDIKQVRDMNRLQAVEQVYASTTTTTSRPPQRPLATASLSMMSEGPVIVRRKQKKNVSHEPPSSSPVHSAPLSVPAPQIVSSPAPTTPSQPKDAKIVEAPEKIIIDPSTHFDFTKIPSILEEKFEKFDSDNQLHPTTIKIGPSWVRKSQKGLLVPMDKETLGKEQQKNEKNKAFDLLDALSRSGSLPVDFASLHVVIATTHSFDKSLLNTVIQDNQNPIEKVERSTLILGTTIHGCDPQDMIKPEFLDNVAKFSPKLFLK